MKKFYLLTMLLCGCMTVAQAQNRGNYAYALSATVGDTETVFNFKSTGDASGSILFTDDAGTDLGKAVTVASVKKATILSPSPTLTFRPAKSIGRFKLTTHLCQKQH